MKIELLFIAAIPKAEDAWIGIDNNNAAELYIVESKIAARNLIAKSSSEQAVQLIENSGLPEKSSKPTAAPLQGDFVRLLVPFATALANNPTAEFSAHLEDCLLYLGLPEPQIVQSSTLSCGLAAQHLANGECQIITLPSKQQGIQFIRSLTWMSMDGRANHHQKITQSWLADVSSESSFEFSGSLVNQLCAAFAASLLTKRKAPKAQPKNGH